MAEQFGYAGKVLRVDLSSGKVTQSPTMNYVDRFLGGRGLAAKIYWDEVSPKVKPFDPENRLIFAVGPLAGFPGLASSRWTVCGKSPTTIPESFSYCNLGGHWGANLRFAGYDGLIVQGKSDKPVYIFIENDKVEVRDASSLWLKGAVKTREILKQELGNSARVVATGPAGDHMVRFATLQADDDASGSCGFAAVMGSKKLKAIVVRGSSSKPVAADPARLRELTAQIRQLVRRSGDRGAALGVKPEQLKNAWCWGCIAERNCQRRSYTDKDGISGKFMCQSSGFYQGRAARVYGWGSEVPFQVNRLCDDLGIDTQAMECMLKWLWRCMQAGILTDASTGIPISKTGSLEFMDILMKKIAFREGIGDTLAEGTIRAAEALGPKASALVDDSVYKTDTSTNYCGREYITTGLLFAMEPRRPIQQMHEVTTLVFNWVNWAKKQPGAFFDSATARAVAKRFWGSEIAADFSTYEGKALAAKMIQDREYAKESLILCDFAWPIMFVEFADNHVGDPSIESKVLSAVSGHEVDEAGLYQIGARILNLQRAILIREGHPGRKGDTPPEFEFTKPVDAIFTNVDGLVPGKNGEVMSRKGQVMDRQAFELMKDEYYQLRGWDVATGLQTRANLEELGLQDIAKELASKGLIV